MGQQHPADQPLQGYPPFRVVRPATIPRLNNARVKWSRRRFFPRGTHFLFPTRTERKARNGKRSSPLHELLLGLACLACHRLPFDRLVPLHPRSEPKTTSRTKKWNIPVDPTALQALLGLAIRACKGKKKSQPKKFGSTRKKLQFQFFQEDQQDRRLPEDQLHLGHQILEVPAFPVGQESGHSFSSEALDTSRSEHFPFE